MALPSQEYLKTTVMTASREMLMLMLWDGAIRFAEQGKEAIHRKDIEGSYNALLRSQRIISELTATLKHEVNPGLCGKLAAVYNFIYRRLVDANISKNPKLVDDAIEIMRHHRETWVMLMNKLSQEKQETAQAAREGEGEGQPAAEEKAAVALPRVPAELPKAVPAMGSNAARRAYPNFASRPAAASQGISVQG